MSLWGPSYVLGLSSSLKLFLMLSLPWPFSGGRLLVRLSKVYGKGTFGPLQALLLSLGGAELNESAKSPSLDQVFGYWGLRKDMVLPLLCPLFIIFSCNFDAELPIFLGKGWIFVLRTMITYQFWWLFPVSASCWVLLRFQLINLRLCQPLYWKHIFEQNLYIHSALCWLPAPNVAPNKQGSLTSQSYTVGISSKRCACSQHENFPPNTHQQNLLTDLIYLMLSPLVLYKKIELNYEHNQRMRSERSLCSNISILL